MLLWLLSVLAGTVAMIIAMPFLGFGPITWGIGAFAMCVASWPEMRRRGTKRGFLAYVLICSGGALIAMIVGTVLQRLVAR